MKYLTLFLLLITPLFALEKELIKASKSAIEFSPPSHGKLVTQSHPSFFPKVNPITGEYCEEETDFVVAGCQPLSVRRFYNHLNAHEPRYGSWRINPEWNLIANLQWNKSCTFASVGGNDGSMLFLGDCQSACIDGRNILCFNLDSQNIHGVTNLGSDPRHIKLHFWPEYGNEGKSRYLGFVIDDSGRKKEFYTPWFKWHKKSSFHINPRKQELEIPPQNWIPYQLIVHKEILPNGNIIIYEHRKWQDELDYPLSKLLLSITAYNQDQSQKLAEIRFDYYLYNWRHKEYVDHEKNFYFKKTVWEVAGYTVRGSDERSANLSHSRRNRFSYPIVLQTVQTQDKTFRYNYSPDYYLNSVDLGDGRVFHTEYDRDHKVAQQKGPYGTISRYEYYPGRTMVFDAENHLTRYDYDDKKRITGIQKVDSIERYIWDDQSRLLAKTMEDSTCKEHLRHRYTYDDSGHVIKECLTGNLTGSGQNENYNLYRTYEKGDPFHLKRSESDDFGKTTYYKYKQGTNLLEKESVYVNEQLQYCTSYEYDNCAICTRKTIEATDYTLITVTTPKKSFPCFGLPEIVEEKTRENGKEILLSKVVYTYHPSGKIESEAHFDCENKHRYTLYNTYDNKERLISSIDALGYATTYEYDSQNNLISQKTPHSHTTWTYDLENRPLTENHSGLETRFTYNKMGRKTSITDPNEQTTYYTYDSLGRMIRIQHPDGGKEEKQYDLFSNVTQESDPNGYTTHKKYNIRNQITEIQHPDGSEESLRYDTKGNLIEHTKNGYTTLYTYDPLDHLIEEKTADYTKKTTYSPFCKLSETDENGITTYYTYDTAGRLIGEQKENLHINYSYDSLGRLTRTQKPFTTSIYEYDLLGRLIEKRIEDNGHITFQESYLYDSAGNKTHTITQDGVSVTSYNAHHQPTQATDPCGNTTTYTYQYKPQFTKITQDPDGLFKIETHDPCGRLKSIQIVKDKPIQNREFIYDLAGNKIQDLEHVCIGGHPTKTIETHFEYGPRGRIESVIESNLKETRYLYDSQGRLSTIIKPDLTEIHHTYDPVGRLKNLKSKGIDYTYTYDPKGRIIRVNDTYRNYDAFDHLTQEKLANGYILNYAYDAEGRLIQLELPDHTTTTFQYLGDKPSHVTYQGLTTSYICNTQGKPTLITLPNHLGTIQIAYDPCQRPISIQSPYFTGADYKYNSLGYLTHYMHTDPIGPLILDYAYDDLHQLISENAHTYTYDSLYNRISKDEISHILNTLNQITHDGDINYLYDPNGNLIQAGEIRFGYDALDRLTHVYKNQETYTYTYDAFNRRLTKQTPKKTIHYLWQGKDEIGSSLNELRILGEGLGAEIGATVLIKLGSTTYFPLHDHRGNIVCLIDSSGKTQETNRYTAYGEALTTSSLVPWRFSSKRFDPETGYYYFGRRYYSPPLGRWITPDPQGFADGPNLYAYAHNSPLFEIDLYGEWGEWLYPRRFGRAAFDFAFPCGSALYNLPANAPMWKRGALAFGAVGEAALLLSPPAKFGVSLAEKTIFQLSRSAISRSAERNMLRSASKTAGVAAERKIAPTITKGSRNRFTPNYQASGAHSVFRRDPITGKVTHYETYRPQTNPRDPKPWESVLRFDLSGRSHTNKFLNSKIETPHIHDPYYPGGIRPAESWEIPLTPN